MQYILRNDPWLAIGCEIELVWKQIIDLDH